MNDLSLYVYKENETFYFDTENYTEDVSQTMNILYEDGDMICWIWEGKKMCGIIRKQGYSSSLFTIQKIKMLHE